MKASTSQSYFQRVQNVIEHVVSNLEGDLSTETLAQVANFSPYHFHRVFKAIANETLGEFVSRVKLERASKLLKDKDLPLDIISSNSGYQSTESFSRAFRRGFGISPGKYRNSSEFPKYFSSDSRIIFDPKRKKMALSSYIEDGNMQIDIVTKPAVKYAYISHTGAYENVRYAFDELIKWATTQGISLESAEVFSHSFDNPVAVSTDELRSEACIRIDHEYAETDRVKMGAREKQRYAVYAHLGSYTGITQAYQNILQNWLPRSNQEIDDCPFIEHYKNDCGSLPEEQWITDLCIPLKTN